MTHEGKADLDSREFVRLPGLRAARERVGLPLTTLARKADVSRDTLVKLERGDREAYGTTALRIAKALGVSMDELIRS
jgi:DNA-binding XRE family transcriptional regulator